MQTILEQMWEGEAVKIFVTPVENEPRVKIGWVFTHRMAIINGRAYTVDHGYLYIEGRPVSYEETAYKPFSKRFPDVPGTILQRDPAPHPERNTL